METNHSKRTASLIRAALSLTATGVLAWILVACSDSENSTEVAISPHPAPAWELKDLEGKPVAFTNFLGNVVLLNFWATWCGPCVAETADLVKLQREYAGKGFTIVGISLDSEGAPVVSRFAKEYGINYPVLLGNEAVTKKFGDIEMIPTTFLIDRTGTIVAERLGRTTATEFEKQIASLLTNMPPNAAASPLPQKP